MVLMSFVALSSMAQATLWEKVKMPFKTDTRQANAEFTCYVKFSDDKVWIVKDGSTNILDDIFVTLNGTLVKPDGTIRLQNKMTDRMNEGDIIDWYGMLIPAGKEKILPHSSL